MYIVTNRTVDESKHSENEAFGSKPIEGPNELRLAEATRRGNRWHINILPDQITPTMAKSVDLNSDNTYPASAYVARKLIEKSGHGASAQKSGRNLLLFVHGYNNDMTFEEQCCIPEGTFTLQCVDVWWDGWNGHSPSNHRKVS